MKLKGSNELQKMLQERRQDLKKWLNLIFQSKTIFESSFEDVIRNEAFLPFWAVCLQKENENEEQIKKYVETKSDEELMEALLDGLLDIVLDKFGIGEALGNEKVELNSDDIVNLVKAWLLAGIVMLIQMWSVVLLMGPADLEKFAKVLEDFSKSSTPNLVQVKH